MCVAPTSNPGPYNPSSIFSGTTMPGLYGSTNPEFVAQTRREGKMQQTFGDNPFVLKSVAKTEGREYDPNDPYGNISTTFAKRESALNQRIADFENRQQQYEQGRAQLGTITQTQAEVKTPSTATRTPQRVRPIRSSLTTTSGVKQIPTSTSLSGGSGLNVPV